MANIHKIENSVHEHLHTNIYLLTLKYPASKDFHASFKQQMFVKSNKSAFQHVIHYLLNILDAAKFKTKVTSWPIYDAKTDVQFRNEIAVYISELPKLYAGSNTPVLLKSHLVSPGGNKFAGFMYKLSQLVMHEHLKRTAVSNRVVLSVPKRIKNVALTQVIKSNFNKLTTENKKDAIAAQLEHEKFLQANRIAADNMIDAINEASSNLETVRKQLSVLNDELEQNNLTTILHHIDDFKERLTEIESVDSNLRHCNKLALLMNTTKISFKVQDDFTTGKNGVSVMKILQDFVGKSQLQNMTLCGISKLDVTNYLELCRETIKQLTEYNSDLDKIKEQLTNLSIQ